MKELYQSISQRISLLSQIGSVDLYRNQLETWTKETVYKFPLVLVEILEITWETLNGNSQRGFAKIRIHTASAWIGDTRAGSSTQEQALRTLQLAQEVHIQLQNFATNTHSALQRYASAQDVNPNTIYVITQDYTCESIDNSTSTQKDLVEATPDVHTKFEKATPTKIFVIKNPNSI